MILSADTKELKSALQFVGRVIPAKSPWPIMQSVRIATNDNRITLTGSDNDTTLETECAAAVDTEGAFCIPFATLAKFVGSAKSETLRIEVENHHAKISAGRNRITLTAEDVRDYPIFTPAEGDLITVDGKAFCAAMKFALAPVEESEVKYRIAGVNISQVGDDLHFWGTHGPTAHHAIMSNVDGVGSGATVPFIACGVILGLAEKSDTLEFMVNGQGWHIATSTVRAWGKVIADGYPDMATVIKQFASWDEIACLPKQDFGDAISIATCGADVDSTKNRTILLRADDGGGIAMRGHRAMGGVIQAGRSEIEIESKIGFRGGFNVKWLNDALIGLDDLDIRVEGCLEDGEIGRGMRISAAQQSATLTMQATINVLRIPHGEFDDV